MMIFSFFFVCFLGGVIFLLPSVIGGGASSKTSLEAGFFSTGSVHLVFSLQFIFLMLIFVIFDTEILLVFGFIVNKVDGLGMSAAILLVLALTLATELKWNKSVWVG